MAKILSIKETDLGLEVLVDGFPHTQPVFPATLTPEELQIAVDAWAVTQAEIDSINNGTATPEIIAKHAPKPPEKLLGLKHAENMYILFCRSLGLPDKATTEQIETLCMSLYNSGVQANINQALLISAKALALINNVTQNGGSWFGIEWHEDIVEVQP